MPDQPLYIAELGSHDQPCFSSFSQGKHGCPIAACRRNMSNKGTASTCLWLGREATRKANLGADAPSQGGTGLPHSKTLARFSELPTQSVASCIPYRSNSLNEQYWASRQRELPAIESPSGPQILRAVGASTPEVRRGGTGALLEPRIRRSSASSCPPKASVC